jgi:asparagine synthase (glutamine-hydrolysing)
MQHLISRIGRRLADWQSASLLRQSGGDGIVRTVRHARLTYLGQRKFAGICSTLSRLQREGVEGTYIEAGCALGGSSIVIGSLRPAGTAFRIHDVFGMIPPPTDADPPEVIQRYQTIVSGKSKGIGGDTYYGYVADLESVVRENLARHLTADQMRNIDLVKGLLQETLEVTAPVAFAHIDVDWYDPVKVSLERIVPWLAPGGAIILDDYFDWGGCRKAVDEYLAGLDVPLSRQVRFGNLILTRLRQD